jgi:hypothetical protein
MDAVMSLKGPVERVGGTLCLRIPLEAGGTQLAASCLTISRIEDELLVVDLPDWLAEKLHVTEGSTVWVDNRDGKFTITPADTLLADDGSNHIGPADVGPAGVGSAEGGPAEGARPTDDPS